MSETWVSRGRWWLADKSSSEGVPGTLTLSDEEFRLDLEGTLLANEALKARVSAYRAPVPLDRILGETTDRAKITLERCDLSRTRTHHQVQDRDTRHHESYRARVVCVGAWFLADEPLAFDKVFVRLSSLHPWTAISGFDPPWQMVPVGYGETLTQSYTPPPEHRAELSDGTVIKLVFPLAESAQGLYTFEKTLTQATRFEFEFPATRELAGVQTLVLTLRNFLTLAVGEGVKVTELVGYREPLPTEQFHSGREVEILYRHLENPRARELPHHHDMLFVLPDISAQFEEHVGWWFDRAPELGRVLDLYFSTLHAEFVYLETRFMNFAQAIEGYHRRRLNRLTHSEETFDAHCATILDGLQGGARRLAKKALNHANEISLEDRIQDVVQLLCDSATSVVAAGKMTPDVFARRAAAIRNIYAHNLESEEPEHYELVVFTFQLKTLVEALLLHEIGFAPSAIDEMLREARRYDLIQIVAEEP